MLPRIILILFVLITIFVLIRWFVRAKPANVIRTLRKAAIAIIIGVLILLAVTGRLHWLFALIASVFAFLPRLLPLLRYIPLLSGLIAYLKRKKTAFKPSAGQQSRVETRFLRMTLDHDSGAMNGEILDGQFKGKLLSDLQLEQLLSLYKNYRSTDEQSAALLQAYLDRIHGDTWRSNTNDTNSSVETGIMGRQEAYEILGLSPDASHEEIIDAHRRLMQKLHPDRGGSTYLAAKINQAKDLLLSK